MKKRRVIVLGATGSIGQSAAKVARDIPDRMEIIGMAGHSSAGKLAALANEMRPARLCMADEARAAELAESLTYRPEILGGEEGLVELAQTPDADMVLIAIVGTAGLRPALAAIEAGKDIAVASKEILVMAGEAVMHAAREKGVHVLPVDSEHNAIFQCLDGRDTLTVRRLILTASGGPFRTWPIDRLAGVTPEQALRHPTWQMGAKITIDSATLFNKGLEMIEARWLFGVEMDSVDVVVHPQSLVHSMVEFVDGSMLAQLSHSDMCFPIQYAVTWPERVVNSLPPLDLVALGELRFEGPRYDAFPALNLARRAGEIGGTLPAVMNAANEVAVAAFLARKIPFPKIWQVVERVMNDHEPAPHPTLETIVASDRAARDHAAELME